MAGRHARRDASRRGGAVFLAVPVPALDLQGNS
jgi:hypothetical protein